MINWLKSNVYQILAPMHEYTINSLVHNFIICYANVSYHLSGLNPKFTGSQLLVSEQQRWMGIQHVYNILNQIIVYFGDRSMGIVITGFLRRGSH